MTAQHATGWQGIAPDMDAFRLRIAQARKDRRMSLEDVAVASGFTKSHVWELERGKSRNPTVRAVWSLSSALGVSPAYLLGLDDQKADLDPLAHQVAALINTELNRRGSLPPPQIEQGERE